MKTTLSILLFCITSVIAGFDDAHENLSYSAGKPADKKGFAVIELFTSEGCSSCPPADALIEKIQKENIDPHVYVLAFHVDYWNRLGWKDSFSDAAYSKRQNRYAEWLRTSSVYTPQIVANGKKEFIGSEEGTLRNAISADLSSVPVASLSLSELHFAGHELNLHYHINGVANHSKLVLALVQKSAISHVKAGENEGRTLAHVQIVRQLEERSLEGKKDGELHIAILKELPLSEGELVGLLQNEKTGEILAADKAEPGSFSKL